MIFLHRLDFSFGHPRFQPSLLYRVVVRLSRFNSFNLFPNRRPFAYQPFVLRLIQLPLLLYHHILHLSNSAKVSSAFDDEVDEEVENQ